MKKILNIAIALVFTGTLLVGCEDLLDVDSNQLALPSNHQLNSPNDTIYSMIGIFSKLEKLSERYVILGELRGDLMEITSNSNQDLQEVYNFDISDDNKYNQASDYYTVINLCNYLINNIDTAIVSKGEKVMYKEFAAAKAIRAWTYMQLAINHGKAVYYKEPILDVVDTKKNYPTYTLEQLAPYLIADLLPWKDVPNPGSIDLGDGIGSKKLFFPIRMVLGDLYLWIGEYENAAREYYQLMYNQGLVTNTYRNYWDVENGVFLGRYHGWEYNMFRPDIDGREEITLISGSTEFGKGSEMDSLMNILSNQLSVSDVGIANWDNEVYYHTNDVIKDGDLRGNFASYYSEDIVQDFLGNSIEIGKGYISKFSELRTDKTKSIGIYRVGILYLRYAEAVNRLNKPNLAFAVLKNGLGLESLSDDAIVPRDEKYLSDVDGVGVLYDYIKFDDDIFHFGSTQLNIGIHARGCGNLDEATDYKIPELTTLEDSVLFVEDAIIKEFALESAFEGNRFQDLMRVAKRRSDPSYLADKVAEKYENKEAVRSTLMNETNWYLH